MDIIDQLMIAAILLVMIGFGIFTLYFIARVHGEMDNIQSVLSSVDKNMRDIARFKSRAFRDCDVDNTTKAIRDAEARANELAEMVDSDKA